MDNKILTGIVISTSACVKNGAGVNSSAHQEFPLLPYGTIVNILEEIDGSGGMWYKITLPDNSIGYTYSCCIEHVLFTAKIIVDTKVYEFEGVGNKVITTLPNNTDVAITSVNKSGTWGFDMISRGWISSEFIR